jgi:hypothetical protein
MPVPQSCIAQPVCSSDCTCEVAILYVRKLQPSSACGGRKYSIKTVLRTVFRGLSSKPRRRALDNVLAPQHTWHILVLPQRRCNLLEAFQPSSLPAVQAFFGNDRQILARRDLSCQRHGVAMLSPPFDRPLRRRVSSPLPLARNHNSGSSKLQASTQRIARRQFESATPVAPT